MLSSVCRYRDWLYRFYKANATDPIGKGTGDNLTVRIDIESRHQISNTLLYNLSTSVFIDENWCSSGLALSVHNPLRWAHCYERLIRIPGIRGVRLDYLLFDCSLEWGSRGYWRSHSRKEAWIICINWWIGITLPAPTSAKISSYFLLGGFVVIQDVVLIIWMIDEFPWIFAGKIGFVIQRLVAPRAQWVGGLRGPHLNRHEVASCFQ